MSYFKLALATGLTGIAVAIGFRYSKKPTMIKESEFNIVMKELSIAIFEKLFEFAQSTQRVVRNEFSLEHDKTVFKSLEKVQAKILKQENISEAELKAAEKKFKTTSYIPEMFNMYISGKFPVLSLLTPSSIPNDQELLDILDLVLETKIAVEEKTPSNLEEAELKIIDKIFPSRAHFSNLLAIRINESEKFRSDVVHIVARTQCTLKASFS